ncbi:MAG: ftsL [Rickettsiaceae bacterium]|jgi:cell division protein FtsL|nr:ftsL [Rickettsiaceae bacterium]
MRNKSFSLIGIILLIISVYGVLAIKQIVLDLRIHYAELERQLEQEKDTIYILKAELAYLQSPERIKKLADKYLKLESINSAQMVNNPLAEEDDTNDKKMQLAENRARVKWRYKKSPSKYITTVSDVR